MRTEKILAALFFLGLLFKFQHWPMAGMFLVLSLSGLAIIYFPAAFYFFSDKNIKQQNIPLTIISGLLLSFIPIGILFKVLFWPGAGYTYLLIGCVTAPIILATTLYLRSKTNEELSSYYRNLLLRTSILTVLTFLFLMVSTETLIKIQERDNPELARLKIQSFTNPDNEEYRKELKDYMLKKDSVPANQE